MLVPKMTSITVLYPVLLKRRFQKNLVNPFPMPPITPIIVKN